MQPDINSQRNADNDVKIRNEIQALIRIQGRNNNVVNYASLFAPGKLMIVVKRLPDCFRPLQHLCALLRRKHIPAIAFGGAFNVDLWEYVMDRDTSAHQTLKPVKCGSVSGAIPVNGKRLGALLLFLACPESGQLSLRHIPASLREPLLY